MHDIDVISYLYGNRILEVYTIAGKDIHSLEDHASIMLRFNDNKAGMVDTNWLTPHKVRKMSVIGIDDIAHLDYNEQTVSIHDGEWIRQAKIEKGEPLKRDLSISLM